MADHLPVTPDHPLARVLEARRSRFNSSFAQVRQTKPRLQVEAFLDHLGASVAPVVEAMRDVSGDRLDRAVDALYDVSLDLVAADLLGPASRLPALVPAWKRLLAGLPGHVAAEPRRVVGALSNALYNLAVAPGARLDEWVSEMMGLGAACPDPHALLEAGKMLAWRAGLAQYREGALEACRTLPPPLRRRALGLPAAGPVSDDDLLARLAANPWLLPQAADRPDISHRQLQLVARVGGFRGFGGILRQPPMVAAAGDRLYLLDGDDAWLLCADAFGAQLFRSALPPDPPELCRLRLDPRGMVAGDGLSLAMPLLAGATGQAGNAATLAVSLPRSHWVYLVGIVPA